MRRRAGNEDSMDLLLDTICNMFGLVIFIAVLAAVLAGARADHQIARSTTPAEVPDEKLDLQQIHEAVQRQERRVDEDLEQQRRLLASQLDAAQAELARRRAMHIETPDGAEDVDLDALFASNRALEQDLERARALRDITMRTPRRHELEGRLPVQVMLMDDRFLLLNDWSGWHTLSDPVGDRCAFWTSWNPDVVDPAAPEPRIVIHEGCTFRTGGQDIERWVTLRPEGGVELAETAPSERAVSELLDQLDPNRHVISLKVAPDSFDTFGLARRAVVDAGFPYDVTPYPLADDRQYHDRIRIGTATGQ